MSSVVVFIFWAIIIVIGYFLYSKWVNTRVFEADASRATPAKMYMDGVDFMPANKNVLYGFQLNSIAGAAPIIGPIIALQWGWLLAAFVLFRLFDILKPWPIRQLDQKVSGGFGIMLDDAVAALFTMAVLALAQVLI